MLKDLMMAEASRVYPNEACGLIVQVGSKSVPIACTNASEVPTHQFLIPTDEYLAACERGEVIGVWHTHVNILPTPSEADKVGCEASALPWFILSIFKNEADEVSFSDIHKLEPSGYELDYLGRPYVFGVLDCWSLCRDYYRREYSIELDDFPRISEFWKAGHDFFEKNWAEQGFVRQIDQEPQAGDLLMMQTDSTGKINHIAVYLGDGIMMHHCHGRLSKREVYGGYWLKHTSHHLRFKTKC